jgi:quercetin 2,3-dioxygenase
MKLPGFMGFFEISSVQDPVMDRSGCKKVSKSERFFMSYPTFEIRRFDSLGHADHGWLDARHHFSFASYHDPARMGWGALRVWNDDRIAPHKGFAPHAHSDMEIVTFVRSGAITHQDNLGNQGRTEAGDVQVMSAGTGIRHSEFNREPVTTTLFQIWILPDQMGAAPAWGAKPFPKQARMGQLQVLASGYGEEDALPLRAQARVYGATLDAGSSVVHEVGEGQHAYLVPASGRLSINGETVEARDGVAMLAGRYELRALNPCEIVLVDTR